ncbi:DUF2834 domain-containing protein [Mycobacteroides chelonae]|uniref:DUF2834 domain-containing protein n=1 Tax=Mycobacteroides chelonae TaxID=1774 RepID=UPI0008A95501|nr:DUF2834 domain-containing protein [Mycobacteroides chelonae]OHU61749.1 hypothetical protein BKG85_22540 [Mycobacteroides chelonae]
MSTARRNLCALYGVIALIALVATWWHNVAYISSGGKLVDVVTSAYANHVAGSLTNDLMLLTIAALVLMVVETRRLGIKHIWVYIALCFLSAISVAFPLFLIARERRLAALADGATGTQQ